jgi:hypothetical protein
LAEFASKLDTRDLALAADGHAEPRASTGVIGIAFETLGLSFAKLHLPAPSPRAEKHVEAIAGVGLGTVRRDEQQGRRHGDGSQEPLVCPADH